MHYIRLFSENMRQGQVGGVKKLKLEETSFMDGPLDILVANSGPTRSF